jgi:hypothetical protein
MEVAMRKFICAAVLVVAMLIGLTARAEEHKGEKIIGELLERCKNRSGDISQVADQSFCQGVITGVSRVMMLIGTGKYAMCIRSFTSYNQMIQAFINWAEANPTRWQDRGTYGVIHALRETWPCK